MWQDDVRGHGADGPVSMESGLEGRNNANSLSASSPSFSRLNGVRPRRPEQCPYSRSLGSDGPGVSMESGLEGRNNASQFLSKQSPALAKSQWSPA